RTRSSCARGASDRGSTERASTRRSAASTWSAPHASPARASAHSPRTPGARFGSIGGDSALTALALYQFALAHLAAAGFTPVIPPVLVREEAMYGTGFFPTERSNIYALEAD